MDSIQLKPYVPLNLNSAVESRRFIQYPRRFFSNQYELSEINHPLLASYLLWLRRVNSVHNTIDIQHENEQKFREFNFLYTLRILLFLKVCRQFNALDKLLKIQSLAVTSRHLISVLRKRGLKSRQRKKKRRMYKLEAVDNCSTDRTVLRFRGLWAESLVQHIYNPENAVNSATTHCCTASLGNPDEIILAPDTIHQPSKRATQWRKHKFNQRLTLFSTAPQKGSTNSGTAPRSGDLFWRCG